MKKINFFWISIYMLLFLVCVYQILHQISDLETKKSEKLRICYEKLHIRPHFSRQGISPGIGDWHLGECFTTFVGVFYMTGVRNTPKCWKTANLSWKVANLSDITLTETEIITECQVLLFNQSFEYFTISKSDRSVKSDRNKMPFVRIITIINLKVRGV